MYDPLNPKSKEVDYKEGLKGLLAIGGCFVAVLIPVLVWLVWLFFFSPPPKPVAQIPPSPDAPTSTPAPTYTLVMAGGDFLRTLDLRFTKFQVIAPSCQGQAEFQVLADGKPVLANSLTKLEVWLNNQLAQSISPFSNAIRASGSNSYGLAFSALPICKQGGAILFKFFAGNVSVSKNYFWEPSQGLSSLTGLNQGSIQLDLDKYPIIVVYFSVVDANGNAIRLSGLTTTHLYQDGAEVTDYTMTPVDADMNPVTAALVLDSSGSMAGAPLTNARAAATSFINTLGAKDSVCLYSFSTTVAQIQTCTTDKATAVKSLNVLNATGNTALYDVVSAVAGDHAKRTGRQVVIALSDGADTASKASLQDSLNRIKQTNVPLHTIGLVNKDLNSGVLRQFATNTGGAYLEAPSSTDLKKLYDQIQGQLKNQYMVVFRSLFPNRNSGTVMLRLKNGDQTIELSRSYFVK